MKEIYYDIIYLAACGVNGVQPSDEFIRKLKRKEEKKETSGKKTEKEVPYMEMLYRISRAHFLDALVGTVLKQAQVALPKKWTERISKAVRKNLLFDVERKKLFDFMEQKGIWYMPLKGVVLKDYYPAVGMRQMSDNDILFDASYCDEIGQYMKSQGYEAVSVGQCNHDVYEKEPVYNFEMHRALYGKDHDSRWVQYYQDVKTRLIRDNDSSCGYHFSDEDFYVYILCHAYKHYAEGGTGLRSLLDFYVFLNAKEQKLDFAYIQRECKVLGIDAFEEKSRILCKKVFSGTADYDRQAFEEHLSGEEKEMLSYYFSSGVYGNLTNSVANKVKEKGRAGYLLYKIFKPFDEMKPLYPVLERLPVLLPVCWVVRLFKMAFIPEKRQNAASKLRAFGRVIRHQK